MENGKLRFDGEYKNDFQWNGKGYDINGKFSFEINNGNGKIKDIMMMVKLNVNM